MLWCVLRPWLLDCQRSTVQHSTALRSTVQTRRRDSSPHLRPSSPHTSPPQSGAGKFQIIGLIGFLEFHSELAKPHVMRGGTPGKITPLLGPISLWDPIGTMGGLSEEAKFVQRTKEIANGRLAMIAIISFFSASFIPGSVPFIPNV